MSPRERRAITLIALALAGLAAGGAAYLWSTTPRQYHGPPPPGTSRPIPIGMAWRSAAEGWVVVHDSGSPASFLHHTADAGLHWTRQLALDGPASIRFADARRGTVTVGASRGAGPQVLRTDDGGATWRPVPLPEIPPRTPARLFFLDGEHGWVLARGVLYRTTDGGERWNRLGARGLSEADDAQELVFGADGAGWLVGGGTLLATRDGGEEWLRQPLPVARLEILAPTVSADGLGVLAAYDAGDDRTRVYRSVDAGASWRDPVALPGGTGVRRPAFADGSAGWTAIAGAAWSTGDGGRTWRPAAGLPAGWLFGTVVPVSGSVAWVDAVRPAEAGSPDGPATWGLFRTTDAGEHWSRAPLPGP